jgi:hypothetical protein
VALDGGFLSQQLKFGRPKMRKMKKPCRTLVITKGYHNTSSPVMPGRKPSIHVTPERMKRPKYARNIRLLFWSNAWWMSDKVTYNDLAHFMTITVLMKTRKATGKAKVQCNMYLFSFDIQQ